jgi:hypothetical protein
MDSVLDRQGESCQRDCILGGTDYRKNGMPTEIKRLETRIQHLEEGIDRFIADAEQKEAGVEKTAAPQLLIDKLLGVPLSRAGKSHDLERIEELWSACCLEYPDCTPEQVLESLEPLAILQVMEEWIDSVRNRRHEATSVARSENPAPA